MPFLFPFLFPHSQQADRMQIFQIADCNFAHRHWLHIMWPCLGKFIDLSSLSKLM
jgi:hypothetical protein